MPPLERGHTFQENFLGSFWGFVCRQPPPANPFSKPLTPRLLSEVPGCTSWRPSQRSPQRPPSLSEPLKPVAPIPAAPLSFSDACFAREHMQKFPVQFLPAEPLMPRRTNVQQLTCKIDLSNSFYYLFFSFVILELKPFVLKGEVPGEKL